MPTKPKPKPTLKPKLQSTYGDGGEGDDDDDGNDNGNSGHQHLEHGRPPIYVNWIEKKPKGSPGRGEYRLKEVLGMTHSAYCIVKVRFSHPLEHLWY